MRWGVWCTALVAGMSLVQVASASGDTLCVPSNTIPGCPKNVGLSEPTIGDATTNAHNGDVILIAAGTHEESVDDQGKSLTFIGAGPTKTLIQAQGTPGMNVSSGSRVLDLGIQVYPGGGNTGLALAGLASQVAITPQTGVTYATGVQLDGGTLGAATVSLPINVSEPSGYGGVVGPGTVSASTISAAVGVGDDALGKTPKVTRDVIRGNEGVLEGVNGSGVVEDSLIRTVGGPNPELGVATATNTLFGSFVVRHSTILGSDSSGSTGVSADANGGAVPATTTVLLDSTILRGYSNSIRASAEPGPFSATTTVTVQRTFYDPGLSHGETGATIKKDSHSGNFNPLFVNPAAGNFQLRAGSPAIDAGSPTLENGESTKDLAGHPRRVIGRRGDALASDVGAYEFEPHAPIVHVTASKLRVTVGQPVTFHTAASDASPGDALSFRWNLGRGFRVLGATVSHTFTKPGRHTVVVKVTDLDRFSATASITVTVQRRRH
jgi:serine protease